jgi:major membrane immunogen (membrane-anchored lipoprotein)
MAAGGIGTLLLGAAGCGSGAALDPAKPLADGEFSAESAPDEEGAIGQVTITVTDGAVSAATFEVYQEDGTAKDSDYGKDSSGHVANPDYYRKAQAAVAAFDVYAAQLVEVGLPQDVDVVSGATWAHDQFVEAAVEALETSQALAEIRTDGATPAGMARHSTLPPCCDEDGDGVPDDEETAGVEATGADMSGGETAGAHAASHEMATDEEMAAGQGTAASHELTAGGGPVG